MMYWFRMVGVIVLVATVAGCGQSETEGEAANAASPEEMSREARLTQMREGMRNRPVPVAVAKVQRGRVDAYYSSTTSLSAEEEAVAVAKTQGVVEKIFVEEGDIVAAGDALAQLDTRKLELEVARTRTNIESLERVFARSRQLFDTKMISPDAFDAARYNLEREQASLALQLYDLAEATIRAPISGTVTTRYIKLGNTLSPNNPAFEIKRADKIEAILNVPERELAKLEEGQPANVKIDALAGQTFEGFVARVAPQIDPQSGTFRVTVELTNPDNLLKPGMFARVDIRYDSNEDTLLVMRDAVLTQKNESSVFVVRDGLANKQLVQLGYSMGGDVEILDGLGEGDEVVITGQGALRNGASVRVVSL